MKYIVYLVIAVIVCYFLFGNEKEPQYIERNFNNGSSISVEVDDSLSRENWDCTGDCSGHNAGYNWAAEKGIDNPLNCGGNSKSFIEGCETYVMDSIRDEMMVERERQYEN